MTDQSNDEAARLLALREQIDLLDREILGRLNQRAQCALEVAEVKQQSSEGAAPVSIDLREKLRCCATLLS